MNAGFVVWVWQGRRPGFQRAAAFEAERGAPVLLIPHRHRQLVALSKILFVVLTSIVAEAR